MSDSPFPPAPPILAGPWFNSPHDIALEALRGQVVVMEAFQMLCPGCVSHGIPQALALMNAKQFNGVQPIVDKLIKEKASADKAIDTLFLATLTRYPTAAERKLMTGYLERRGDPAVGYTGILWILFNTNEFVCNH